MRELGNGGGEHGGHAGVHGVGSAVEQAHARFGGILASRGNGASGPPGRVPDGPLPLFPLRAGAERDDDESQCEA